MDEPRRVPARYFCYQCGKEATYVPERPVVRFGGKTTTPAPVPAQKRIATCPHCGARNELALP